MKKLTLIIIITLITGCAPSDEIIQTAIAETQISAPTTVPATLTQTPAPTPTYTPTPTPGPIDILIRPEDGMGMVYVPEGKFLMGSVASTYELPLHEVYLDEFWIDKTEVTNSMYAMFLNNQGNQSEGGVTWLEDNSQYAQVEYIDGVWKPKLGFKEYPVVEVSWHGAQAFCSWAGMSLPTEAQWEKAAKGDDERIFPWGNTFDCSKGNFDDEFSTDDDLVFGEPNCDGYGGASPVGIYKKALSPYGALDMAGNVYEWVADWYSSYNREPSDNPIGPTQGKKRVLRGGAYYSTEYYQRTTYRGTSEPDARNSGYGFRCASPIIVEENQGNENSSIFTRPADGMIMSIIPAGEFTMIGSTDDPRERVVFLEDYWIDQTEVTNQMYELCVNGGECSLPHKPEYIDEDTYADHPVNNVDWNQAIDYCNWAGGRLPTESEWEKAARGGLEKMNYPWGNEAPGCELGEIIGANSSICGFTTMSVGSFGPNQYELFDMVGNVAEWTDNIQGSGDTSAYRGVLGGGHQNNRDRLYVTNYQETLPQKSKDNFGFRCARSP